MIVLDTHTWVWWVSGAAELSPPAAEAIEGAMGGRGIRVSAISAWEVALLVRRGRLQLAVEVDEWVARAAVLPFLRIVPVDHRIAVRSVGLEGFHADPADRMIVATAQSLGAPLVTRDRRLREYPGVEAIW